MRLWRCAALTLCGACVTAGCGGSSGHKQSGAASRQSASLVCSAAGRAATGPLGTAPAVRIADSDPSNIACLISGKAITADVVAQASPVAWTEYDTAYSHFAQAFGGPGTVHTSSEQPHPVPNLSGNAAWIPAQDELIATNGTQSSGGSYVTVKVTGARRLPPGTAADELAGSIAKATLSTAPRGGSPGPPPS